MNADMVNDTSVTVQRRGHFIGNYRKNVKEQGFYIKCRI